MNTISKPDIHRLLDLQKLIVKFAGVDRKVYLPPEAEIPESDVEHSFSLAMVCWFLAPQFPALDLSKLLQLCLAHDIIEAYCGDTFSFDSKAVASQKDLEQAAFLDLKKDWQDFPALIGAIEEYEERATPEAKFVVTLDRLHPILMDYLTEGRSWHKLDISFEKLMAIKDEDLATSELAEHYSQLKQILIENPQLFPRI